MLIYKITNNINNKCYIGKDFRSTGNCSERLTDHIYLLKKGTHYNKHLQRSYNFYKGNFTFSVLQNYFCITKKELGEYEKYYIKLFNSYKEGYNQTIGGDGFSGNGHSEESKKKISESHKGKPAWNKGKFCSEETKKKIKEARKNQIFTKETRKKMSIARKGKKLKSLTPETIEKLKISIKKGFENGRIPYNKGVSHQKENKECLFCSTTFISYKKANRKFCSKKCEGKYRSEKRRFNS